MSEIKRPDVEAILERAEKATPGPWRFAYDRYGKSSAVDAAGGQIVEPVCVIPHDDVTTVGLREVKANARLIKTAREDVPALCRWIQELERRLKDAEDTINAMNEGPRE